MSRIADPDEPKIFFLPNLMTACNLACGFFAVLMIFKGQIEVQKILGDGVPAAKQYYEVSREYYQYAILLIFGSCLFDLLDGRLARLGGQESPFGQEFDSLADIVSFGMAPAMLLSRAVLFPLGEAGWGVALIYLVCGAMRLARFNCLAYLPKKPGSSSDFRGIPIPMAAGFIASLTFLIIDLYKNDHEVGVWKYVLAAVMLFLSWLMISNVRYPSFKTVDWKTRGSLTAVIMGVVVIIATIQFRYIMPVVLFSVYLLYGFVRPLISLRWRKGIEDFSENGDLTPDKDEAEEAESP
ncbi:MAG: CDP-diacylglycerol--serine O-phosphatidyltransferase [Luteolibacter sp.]